MRKEGARVTLQDIAAATGYTVNTVSRALKDKPDISRETCRKIQQVAREMGYVRNYIASSLRSGRTKTFAMIVGSVLNPFYSILCNLIQQEAVRLGYSLFILCSNDDPEYETRLVEMAISRQADGVLITPCSFESPALVLLRDSGIPFVLLSRFLEGEQDDCVICDDEQGGWLAAHHLLARGHSNLAMFSFHHVVWSSRKRFEGFQRACMEAGVPAGKIHYAEFEGQTEAEIRACVRAWLDAGVTGFFAFCDVEAWNVLSRMEEAGTLENRTIEIVGFDNIFRYISFMKPICSVDPNLAEEARLAVDLIRRRIHDPSLPPQQVMLPVTLVSRHI